MELDAVLNGTNLVVLAITGLITLAYSAAAYVLQGIGLFTVAKRRGIEKPWLAWIPVADVWTLGCISDQYRYVNQGVDPKLRKKLLWLSIVFEALMIPYNALDTYETAVGEFAVGEMFAVVFILIAIPTAVFGIMAVVHQFKAIFDYFRSCTPNRATLYLLLSIFVPLASPILVFLVRNKDLGMPSKADEPPSAPTE